MRSTLKGKLCVFAEKHPVLAFLAAVVVLSLVVGCQGLVAVQAVSVTGSNALCKTLPPGDRSVPLREVLTVPAESTICVVD